MIKPEPAMVFAEKPRVIEEAGAYLVVYKPPRMHTAPVHNREESLAEWCFFRFPGIRGLRGRKDGEGGLLHRLDYETSGLVLFARTQAAFDSLASQQEEGAMLKEYEALAFTRPCGLPGFPPPPFPPESLRGSPPPVIESAFRPYGPGRKAVRPVTLPGGKSKSIAFDRGGLYRTEIYEAPELAELNETARTDKPLLFKLGIRRGFRHQIRCHLAWLGFPILNDPLYGGAAEGNGILALRARGLRFYDPVSGEERSYAL